MLAAKVVNSGTAAATTVASPRGDRSFSLRTSWSTGVMLDNGCGDSMIEATTSVAADNDAVAIASPSKFNIIAPPPFSVVGAAAVAVASIGSAKLLA